MNNRSRSLQIIMIGLICLYACNYGPTPTKQDIEVKGLMMEKGKYNVKVFIPKEIRDKLESKIIENMTYRADSSIFFETNLGNIYPEYIETIANANRYQIEYIVYFNNDENLKLYFNDRYITQKDYLIKLF